LADGAAGSVLAAMPNWFHHTIAHDRDEKREVR